MAFRMGMISIIAGIQVIVALLYGAILLLLTTEFGQRNVVYLNAFQMTGNKDLNVPEMFGFLKGQVTSFQIPVPGGSQVHAWHILPIGVYRKHQSQLYTETGGLSDDMTFRLGFTILRDDPNARLVIHIHGAGGNIASGYRVANYKALSAAEPHTVHVLTFDYRGFGLSSGIPSEAGLIEDTLAVIKWATEVAQIHPSNILIFSQSLGTAVNMAVAERLSKQITPTTFAGHILVAPFVDVPILATTYRIAGIVPLLSPVAKIPFLFDWLKRYIIDDWNTAQRIEQYIIHQEIAAVSYKLTIIHAEDDYDIPWHHSRILFAHSLIAARSSCANSSKVELEKVAHRNDGHAGSSSVWRTTHGVISEHILKYGLHDMIMGDPTITLATMDIFDDLTSL